MKITYLNKPDKSDPANLSRLLCIVVCGRYVKLTWGWPKIEIGNLATPWRPPAVQP